MPRSAWVNPGFFTGTALPYPAGPLESAGKVLRHIKAPGIEQIDEPANRSLLEAASMRRAGGTALQNRGRVRPKSR